MSEQLPLGDAPASPTEKPGHHLVQVLIVGVLVSLLASLLPFTIIDDAYISFRYAYHLGTTGELVFNPGERVEGITNLLWTLLLTIHIFVPTLSVEQYAVALSLLCLFWAAVRLVQLGALLNAPPYAGFLAVGLLFLSRDFLLATTSGLEGGLYAALLLEVVYQYFRGRFTLAYLVAGLAFLTRPEAIIVGGLLTAVLFYQRRPLRQLLPGLCLLAVIVAGVTLWRLFYYGSPIPNSIIAKSVGIDEWMSRAGLAYLKLAAVYIGSFMLSNWHFVLVVCLSCLWFWRSRGARDRVHGLVMFCLGSILYSVGVIVNNGGDWMPHFRLFMQYGTLYAALFLVLIAHYRAAYWVAGLMVCYVLAQTAGAVLRSPPESLAVRIVVQPEPLYLSVLDRLPPHLDQHDVISAEALGYIGYHLPTQHMHDPLGLVDRQIARYGRVAIRFGKIDPVYTLTVVRPTVLLWHWAGHLEGVEQSILDQYQAFCATDCLTWDADLVMIRRDRAAALAPLFADWQPVRITPQRIEGIQYSATPEATLSMGGGCGDTAIQAFHS